MGLEIIGIPLDDVLRLDHGVANAAGLDVELGQAGGQERGGRVGINGEAIFFDGFVGQFAAAVSRDLFLVHVREGVMVIGGGAIDLARRGLGRLGVRMERRASGRFGRLRPRQRDDIDHQKMRKILFMLDLECAPARFRSLSLIGCKAAGGKVPLFYRDRTAGWGKTLRTGSHSAEGTGGTGTVGTSQVV